MFGDLVIIGERAWDAMRGLDYLLSLRDSESQELKIDPNQIAIVGLSLRGWITAYAGALEPRFALTIPGCCSQDIMSNSQVVVVIACVGLTQTLTSILILQISIL